MIEAIPNSLITCFYQGEEVAVIGIDTDRFRVRLSEQPKEKTGSFLLRYLDYLKQKYLEIQLDEAPIIDAKEKIYWWEMDILVSNKREKYREAFSFITRQYMEYVTDKMESYGNDFSKKMCGYPAEKDEIFADSLQSFYENRIRGAQVINFLIHMQEQGVEVARTICNRNDYENWLLEAEKASSNVCQFDRLYIGNEYCIWQCPPIEMWTSIWEKAKRENVKITVVLPPIAEDFFNYLEELTIRIRGHMEQSSEMQMELLVNDWGSLYWLNQNAIQGLQILAGTLLLKARRDPRSTYRIGLSNKVREYGETQGDSGMMRKLLQESGVHMISLSGPWEQVLFSDKTTKKDTNPKALHIPFYQTNTSSFCTLKAIIETGERGKQSPVRGCQSYCEQVYCAYPEHLSMVGIGNSIFGFSMPDVMDESVYQLVKERGIHRIVWNGGMQFCGKQCKE